jgi:ribonuclease HI
LKLAYLETDASVALQREVVGQGCRLYPAGAGIILRDLRLQPVLAKSVPLGQLPGPLHAEYLALVLGLEEAVDLGISGVWATSDSERLVEAFNGRSVNRADGLEEIADRLEQNRAKLVFVTLRWSHGSHRKLKLGGPTADALARAAVGLGKR